MNNVFVISRKEVFDFLMLNKFKYNSVFDFKLYIYLEINIMKKIFKGTNQLFGTETISMNEVRKKIVNNIIKNRIKQIDEIVNKERDMKFLVERSDELIIYLKDYNFKNKFMGWASPINNTNIEVNLYEKTYRDTFVHENLYLNKDDVKNLDYLKSRMREININKINN